MKKKFNHSQTKKHAQAYLEEWLQSLVHTGRSIPVLGTSKSLGSMLRHMALKTTTAFRFIGRLFTYFKSLYNPCSSKLKGEKKITLSFLIFLIKKVKQNMWYPLIRLWLFSSIFFDSPVNEYCFQILNKKSNIKRLAQGTLYKINYHKANKATASTRSNDSEQDKFRTVLSKRCSGAKGSK